jgi:hypothetical protein
MSKMTGQVCTILGQYPFYYISIIILPLANKKRKNEKLFFVG